MNNRLCYQNLFVFIIPFMLLLLRMVFEKLIWCIFIFLIQEDFPVFAPKLMSR